MTHRAYGYVLATMYPVAFAAMLALGWACGSPPAPCSEADIAARVAATVGAVELLADARCNADRASCPVAQAGLAKLNAIETQCSAGGAAQ